MKAFFDTSVLIATFDTDHPFHSPSIDLFARFTRNNMSCGAHSLAEIYATLTGRTGRNRVSRDEAILVLEEVRQRTTIIALTEREYLAAIRASAEVGIIGGAIYDAVLGHCALKARAETIYTWNVRDFARLGTSITDRTKTPSD